MLEQTWRRTDCIGWFDVGKMGPTKRLCRCWYLATLALSGCGEPPDSTVAMVGDYPIKATSLRSLVGDLTPGQKTDKTGDEARRHYLQILVDGRLLLLEARNRGIDTTRAVDRAVRRAVDERVRAQYRTLKVGTGEPVNEADVRERYEREGFDVERKLSRIVTPDRSTIEEVVEALRAGQPFDEIAAAHSGDAGKLRREAGIGHVGRLMLARLQVPADLFQDLADGEVSEPIPAAGGFWQVVRFTETVPAKFSKYAVLIEDQMKGERRIRALGEHLEMLARNHGAQLNQTGLKELMAAYRRRPPDDLAASSTVLYRYEEGAVTVAEADEALGAVDLRRSFANPSEAEYVLQSFVMNPRLIELAAREAGLYDGQDVREFRRQWRVQELAEGVRRSAVADIEVSEEEVREYYEANPGFFRIEGYAAVEELLLPTESAGREIRDRIAAGETFIDLVAHSLRPDAGRKRARYHFHRQDSQVYPELTAAVEAAPQGELMGPVVVAGGYSVFRVLERVPESVEPYERVSQRARSLLLGRRQAEAVEALILELREKYGPQVVVYSEELTRALPDSLLRN